MRGLVGFLVVLVACGGSEPDSDAGADAGDACDTSGFAATTETAERDDELGVLFYTGLTAGDPYDRLTVDFYFTLGATAGPHTLELDGTDLADCHTCLLIYRGCSGSFCTSATTFLAQRGTLEVSAAGAAGTGFAASLTAAEFAEVEIDFSNQHAALVPGGERWCPPQQAMGATITAP